MLGSQEVAHRQSFLPKRVSGPHQAREPVRCEPALTNVLERQLWKIADGQVDIASFQTMRDLIVWSTRRGDRRPRRSSAKMFENRGQKRHLTGAGHGQRDWPCARGGIERFPFQDLCA
jgi:hypothetical protein